MFRLEVWLHFWSFVLVVLDFFIKYSVQKLKQYSFWMKQYIR